MEKEFNLGHSVIDLDRKNRTGDGEVIFAEGKTSEQLLDIVKAMDEKKIPVLATRVSESKATSLLKKFSKGVWDKEAKTFILKETSPSPPKNSNITVITAGTSDLPVAYEAINTIKFFDRKAVLISDVGVAGLHRLLNREKELQKANVIIGVAGMEGALVSVLGGLVKSPVIAVPTSVGYGAHQNGLTPLLSMLTSCASGISVVNIDNGFGAGYQSVLIDRLTD